ncbi:MAG: dihydropteroate synthase [Bacteroidota bacterium]
MDLIKSLNCRGKLLTLDRPRIMGILNLTPDSFSDGGQYNKDATALVRVAQMLTEGAEIIDIGGYSSRPFAPEVSEQEELDRVYGITEQILTQYPEALISIDTYRPGVARQMLDLGVHIINDISAGTAMGEGQASMLEVVSSYGNVPYIMMHMQGTPRTMQVNPSYEHVVEEIWDFFVEKIGFAREAGIKDVVIDPGFGFGKKIEHNYLIWAKLGELMKLELPMLVGVSRKSMMYKLFNTTPDDVVDLTGILHFRSLEAGANLLRVHDVKEARRVVDLYQYLRGHEII